VGVLIGSAGATGIGSAGATGIAASAGGAVCTRVRRLRVLRDEPVGVNEQTWPDPATGISVSRSPAFLARIETMVGMVAGWLPVTAVDSPNCIATPV
jgi:hypothetical protein